MLAVSLARAARMHRHFDPATVIPRVEPIAATVREPGRLTELLTAPRDLTPFEWSEIERLLAAYPEGDDE